MVEREARSTPFLMLATACLLVACDAETPASSDGSSTSTGGAAETTLQTSSGPQGTSTGADVTSTGDPEASSSSSGAAATTTGVEDCEGFSPSEPFEIAPGTATTRIHPHVAADATGAWFTFVQPDPAGSLFDVMALHLDCSLTADVGPFLVSGAENDIDGSIAVSGDTVAVLWNSDNGQGGSDNLQIDLRLFGPEGVTDDDPIVRLTTEVEGTPITDNHTNGVIVGTEDGFTVAGIRAHPASPAFVAFSQTVDTQGALVGEANSALIEEGVSNLSASAAPGWLGYGVSSDDAGDTVHVLAEGDTAVAVPFSESTVVGVNLLFDPGVTNTPLVAASVGQDNALDIAVTALESKSEPLRLGAAATLEHNPVLAAAPDGSLALVFHRNISGFNNEVVFQRLSLEGDAVVADGDPVVLDDMSPPYPPSLTSVGDGLWLVTWSRGSSPDFTTWGQIVG